MCKMIIVLTFRPRPKMNNNLMSNMMEGDYPFAKMVHFPLVQMPPFEILVCYGPMKIS